MFARVIRFRTRLYIYANIHEPMTFACIGSILLRDEAMGTCSSQAHDGGSKEGKAKVATDPGNYCAVGLLFVMESR